MPISETVGVLIEGDVVRFRYSAQDWARFYQRSFFDNILAGLFDRDYSFTERREAELRCVLEEVVLNSYSACGERNDLFVVVSASYVPSGLSVSVSDEGPGFNYRKEVAEARRLAPSRDKAVLIEKRGDDSDQGGVGLYALITCADSFKYSCKGRKLDIHFKLGKD